MPVGDDEDDDSAVTFTEFIARFVDSNPRFVLSHDKTRDEAEKEANATVATLTMLFSTEPSKAERLSQYKISYEGEGDNVTAIFCIPRSYSRVGLYNIAYEVVEAFELCERRQIRVKGQDFKHATGIATHAGDQPGVCSLAALTLIGTIRSKVNHAYSAELYKKHTLVVQGVLDTLSKKGKAGETLTGLLCEAGDAGTPVDEFVELYKGKLASFVTVDTEQTVSIIATRLNVVKFENDRILWGDSTKKNHLSAIAKAAGGAKNAPSQAPQPGLTSPERTPVVRSTGGRKGIASFRVTAAKSGAKL